MPLHKASVRIAAAALAVFSLPIAAYALVDKPEGATSATTPASVIIFSQKPKGDQITVTYAYMPAPGNLVIHGSSGNGKPDKAVLGSVKLEAGDHRDVGVTLKKMPQAGTSLWASLTNTQDQPFWQTSLPLENEFTIK